MPPRGRECPRVEDVRQFYDISERAAQLPGVRAAGFTQLLPLQDWGWTSNSIDFRVRGETKTIQGSIGLNRFAVVPSPSIQPLSAHFRFSTR